MLFMGGPQEHGVTGIIPHAHIILPNLIPLPLPFQATLLDTPLVKIVALQAIFDCLLVYGIGAFNDADVREDPSPAATPSRQEEDEETEDDDDENESGMGDETGEEEEEDPFQEAYELNSTAPGKSGDKSR